MEISTEAYRWPGKVWELFPVVRLSYFHSTATYCEYAHELSLGISWWRFEASVMVAWGPIAEKVEADNVEGG